MLVTQEPVLRRFWYPLAFAEDLAAGPLQRRLLGVDLVLWLGPDGRPAAARDRCPHREALLSAGWTETGRIVCPYHGWQFDPDGACRVIPQNAADQRPNPRAVLDAYRAVEALGLVWVSLDPEPLGGIPAIEEFGRTGWRMVREFDVEWPCAAPQLLDNNLDLAHLAFVHRGTFGDRTMPHVDVGTMQRTGEGIRARAATAVSARPGSAEPSRRDTTSRVCAPFVGVLQIDYPDGLRHTIVKAIAPVDDGQCRLLQFGLRNDTEADLPAADIIAFDTAVAEEDRSVLATLPPAFPLEVHALVHIDTDRASIAYRRMLAELVGGQWLPSAEPAVVGAAGLA